ncbi:alpha-amylase family glycosyl hydrolase [Citreimonas sp.]|uniref:alpha-amylase family glycosyl hydrolase n=1 Tax=Citreimonas sp. TaxID=3036715 RepID=UPI0040589009
MEAEPRTTRGRWPHNPVIYQIYPRSFRDSTGTGEGDLRGITERLDHVADLGVDAIWLSPFFVSPMCDGGYDVADHAAVDPRFGTLEDFDALVDRAHDLGLLVMIDQVFNHTSKDHPWYKKSALREPPYENFYVWADPNPDGSPPTNWIGFFGAHAWRWNPRRRQYCLHQFLPCQPCLNHHCPELRARQNAITAFWRDRGVDGFRYDAVTAYFHDRALPDNPPADLGGAQPINPFEYQRHQHDMMPNDCAAFSAELRDSAGPDAYLLGEINGDDLSVELVRKFSRSDRLDAAYTQELPSSPKLAPTLRKLIEDGAGHGAMAWWLSSHDQPRRISRAGDGSARDARLHAALLLALPGPVMIFQGDEIGQQQAHLEYHQLRDQFDRNYWPATAGRDGARAPLPWDSDAPNAGFGSGEPWLPVGTAEQGGVAQQRHDDESVLAFHKRALALRARLGLADAAIEIEQADGDRLVLRLQGAKGPVVVALNESDKTWPLPPRVAGREPLLGSCTLSTDGLPPRSVFWWHLDDAAPGA